MADLIIPFADVMLDIETLSVHPNNSVVLSIGAVKFRLFETGPLIGSSRLWVLDIHSQILTRDISLGTLKFWREQPYGASEHWSRDRIHERVQPEIALGELAAYFPPNARVWAHGVCFDIGNIESLGAVAWSYNAVRDCRTIVNSFAQHRTRPADLVGTAHNPVHDCVHQVWSLWEHWPEPLDPLPHTNAESY